MSANWRASDFLGKSNWTWDAYFQGKLDQAVIHNAGRSDSWMKLAYENQKPGQSLATLNMPTVCISRFSAPADAEANEGARINLTGIADCASGDSVIYWSFTLTGLETDTAWLKDGLRLRSAAGGWNGATSAGGFKAASTASGRPACSEHQPSQSHEQRRGSVSQDDHPLYVPGRSPFAGTFRPDP